MPPKGHLPFDLHVLGLPLAFILSQDQTLLCILLFFFFFFCLDSDLFFWIDKVRFVLLYSYLSDFDWIILSKNFAKPLSFLSTPFPVVLRVQRYDFFISHNTFFKKNLIIFHFIFISLAILWLQQNLFAFSEKNPRFLRILTPFLALFWYLPQ